MLRTALMLLLMSLPSIAWAGKYNPVLDIGDKAPSWEKLPGVDGKLHALSDLKDKQVVVLVFTCSSCPYAVDYEGRLKQFAGQYTARDAKVALVAVNVNTVEEDALPAMKKRAEQQEFNFPYLFDESQKIARDFGAGYTPEFFVLDQDRKLVYMGAMDDDPSAEKAKVNYVQQAVDAALSGKTTETKETVPIGCRIRLERRKRTR